MIFYFLISIVFIAEVIIALSLIINLVKADKKIIECNSFVDEAKPSIKGIMEISRKISEQFTEFAPMIVDKVKAIVRDVLMGQLKSLIGTATFWLVKKEVEKHI